MRECRTCGFAPLGTGREADGTGRCLPCALAADLARGIAVAHPDCVSASLPEVTQPMASVLGRVALAVVRLRDLDGNATVAGRMTHWDAVCSGAGRLAGVLARRAIDGASDPDASRDVRLVQVRAADAEVDAWLECGTFADLCAHTVEATGAYHG